MDIQIYEYYDGYEHLWEDEDEKDRVRVKYFVLGYVSDRNLIICYLGDTYNIIAPLGKGTHAKAWAHSTISAKEAVKCVNNGSLGLRNTKEGSIGEDRKTQREKRRA